MQMTVMSEGLLLNVKYIKMGREELKQYLNVCLDHKVIRSSLYYYS